jgi:Salmonella virulence plasmid 65kDa B protein
LLADILTSLELDAVGKDQARASISSSITTSGSASYSIPIKIPPDAAGTEPKIQLVYDSQSIGGPLGAGWYIAGLSIITSRSVYW